MKIEITAFARFREAFGEKTTVESEGQMSLKGALKILCDNPDKVRLLFDDSGDIYDHVLIMHNKKRTGGDCAESLLLKDGDSVVIYPPVSGG